MLAALLFQSPIVAALLLVICGLLLGYALGTGRMHDSDTLAAIAAWLSSQRSAMPGPSPPISTITVDPPSVGSAANLESPNELTAMHHSLAIAAEERTELLAALQSAHEELADLEDDLDSHRRALETIERYRNELRDELAREREQSLALQTRFHEQEELKSRFDAALDELAELRGHNAYLLSQLAAANESHRLAQLEWKTANGESHHYQEEIDRLHQQRKNLEQDAETIRADRESLLASLRSAQEQNRQLTQRIGDQELHTRQLQEELDALYVQREYWETPDMRWRLDAAHELQVPSAAAEAGRVHELEALVGSLREQLRLVQLQAQEMVQRHQEDPLPESSDSAGQLERDRRELLNRIRQQSSTSPSREEAA